MKKSKAQRTAEKDLQDFIKHICQPDHRFDALTVATLMRKIHNARRAAAGLDAETPVIRLLPPAKPATKQKALL